MLKRNYYAKRKKVQELLNSSLLSIGDFNVRVTVVNKNNITSENSWKEVFRCYRGKLGIVPLVFGDFPTDPQHSNHNG